MKEISVCDHQKTLLLAQEFFFNFSVCYGLGDMLSKAGTPFQVLVLHGLEQVHNATSGKKFQS